MTDRLELLIARTALQNILDRIVARTKWRGQEHMLTVRRLVRVNNQLLALDVKPTWTCSDPLDFAGQLDTARRVAQLRHGMTIDGTASEIKEACRIYAALAATDRPKLELAA